MRFTRIDWGSDGTIFLVCLLVLLVVVTVALARASPKRSKRRRLDHRPTAKGNGQLID